MMYADLMGNHKNHRIKSLWDNIVTWHNSVVVLKQQLQQLAAVIGSGLIQALKPFVNAMNNALSGLIKFAQNVVNALGKIFGWEMEVNTSGLTMDEDAYDIDTSGLDDVADKAGNAGKATDKAADSAKKLKEQLQGFDKLNVIRSEDTSGASGGGGGGGGGGSGSGGGGGGGTSGGDVSATLKKTKGVFESEIDNLFDLGRYISNALSTQMEKIQWNKIYSKARSFGTGLANFLNGLITPRLFANVGRTVARSINTAFEFLNSFGTTFKWDNFGHSIGIGINAHLREYNWGTILNAAKVWGKGLATTINKAVSTTSFALVGKTLALQLRTAFTFLYNFGDTLEWDKIGKSIAEGINSFIENFPASQFANTIDTWVQGIGTLIGEAIKNIDKESLIQKIKEFISSLDLKTVSLILKTIALIKGASFAISIGSTLLNAICQEFIKQLAARLVVSMAGSSVLQGAIGQGLGGAAAGSGPMLGQAIAGGGTLTAIASVVGAIGGLALTSKGFFGLWEKGWNKSDGVTVAAGTGISLAALGIAGVLTGPLALAIVGITAGFTLFAANHKKITAGLSKNWEDFKKSFDGTAKSLDGPVSYADAKFKEMKNSGISNTDEERKRIDSNYRQIKNSVTNNSTSASKTSNSKFKDMNTQGSKETKNLGSNVTKTWGTMNKDAGTKLGAKGLQGTVKTNMGNARSSGYNAIKGISGDVNGIWDGLGTTAKKSINGSGKDTVKSKITGAFNDVKSAVKSQFPFSLGKVVKDIQLPVIKVTKREQMGIKTPTLDVTRKTVSNYAKAYNTPWMFTRPTLIPTLNGNKVFGDRNGGEIVYGHQSLMDDIASASGASEMSAIGNRQLANDQRIIQLLTVIAEKEFGISQDAVFKAVRKGASDYSMRTGRGAFEF